MTAESGGEDKKYRNSCQHSTASICWDCHNANVKEQQPAAESATGNNLSPVESVKPCPYCGEEPDESMFEKGSYFCFCISCDDPSYIPIEEWNNAWGHRRIADLERQLDKQGQTIKLLVDRLERYMALCKHECVGFCPDHAAIQSAAEIKEDMSNKSTGSNNVSKEEPNINTSEIREEEE